MTSLDPSPTEPTSETGSPPEPTGTSWPCVVGWIGIIVSAILFVDKLEDLLTPLIWSEEDWNKIFAPDVADLILESLPPLGWAIPSAVIGMALAILLLVGSVLLIRRSSRGVALCRWWALLAILWAVVEMGVAARLLRGLAGQVPGLPAGAWEGFAAFGLIVTFAVILAFPVFLLVWFARPGVRAEYQSWDS